MIIEKLLDLTKYGAQHDINKHIANGWWIDYQGLTYIIMKKRV